MITVKAGVGRLVRSAIQRRYPYGYVTYENAAGLGNRLHLHCLAHAYALKTGRKLVLQWIRNEECGAIFSDLFEPAFPSIDELPGMERWLVRQLLWHPTARDSYLFDPEGWPARSHFESLRDRPERVVQLPHELYGKYQGGLYDLGQHGDTVRRGLIPMPEVRERTDTFLRTLPEPRVGFHLRMGDRVAGRRVSLELCQAIVGRIRSFMPEVKLVLVSNGTAAELEPFIQSCGFIMREFDNTRGSVEGVRDALADMYVLAGCNFVVNTPYSSFSRMGAFLGSRPLVPAVAGTWEDNLRNALAHP
jgi:hypothetical protein